MLCLESEAEYNSLPAANQPRTTPMVTMATSLGHAPTTKSAPASPARNPQALNPGAMDVSYHGGSAGFFEGLLGCLRPVWSIIGKATQAELKQPGKLYAPS